MTPEEILEQKHLAERFYIAEIRDLKQQIAECPYCALRRDDILRCLQRIRPVYIVKDGKIIKQLDPMTGDWIEL